MCFSTLLLSRFHFCPLFFSLARYYAPPPPLLGSHTAPSPLPHPISLCDELPGVPEPDIVVVSLDLVRHLHLLQLRGLVLGLVVLLPPVLFVPVLVCRCRVWVIYSATLIMVTIFCRTKSNCFPYKYRHSFLLTHLPTPSCCSPKHRRLFGSLLKLHTVPTLLLPNSQGYLLFATMECQAGSPPKAKMVFLAGRKLLHSLSYVRREKTQSVRSAPLLAKSEETRAFTTGFLTHQGGGRTNLAAAPCSRCRRPLP